MLIAFFVVLKVYLLYTSIPAVDSTLETTKLGEVNQKFTFQLLKSLQDKNAGHINDIPITNQTNVIFSPFNIGRSLTLLLLEFTKGLIKDLLPARSLNSDTKVVLVDTIYFNSNWGIPFKPDLFSKTSGDSNSSSVDMALTKLTFVKVFTRDDGELEKVKMMYGSNNAQYGETQLKKIEEKPSFTPDQTIKIVRIQYANPNLAIGSADFSGLAGSDKSSRLCISEIFHKAVIEVNEKGTEAAAPCCGCGNFIFTYY
ncbi:leukocyte elastase inhibitor-like [Gordionus sp. m RMFG-2023]|uniref:leukocyte elastase inhibitor-like n=1 Tax=Gordionus sp. m RMFG-2023 TaxID=3053472 RepID=UPI0031FC2368